MVRGEIEDIYQLVICKKNVLFLLLEEFKNPEGWWWQ